MSVCIRYVCNAESIGLGVIDLDFNIYFIFQQSDFRLFIFKIRMRRVLGLGWCGKYMYVNVFCDCEFGLFFGSVGISWGYDEL